MSALTHSDRVLDQTENIYLTARIRIKSESRLRWNAKILNLVIIWYSFVTILLSIADIAKFIEIEFFSTLSVSYSIGILIFSLIMNSEKYQERAERFRECYLKLHRLYKDKSISIEERVAEYHKLLDNYENHSDYDYQTALVSAWWNGKSLYNSEKELKAGWNHIAYVFLRNFMSVLKWIIIFFLPIIIFVFAICYLGV